MSRNRIKQNKIKQKDKLKLEKTKQNPGTGFLYAR